jgi:hypothetical protein
VIYHKFNCDFKSHINFEGEKRDRRVICTIHPIFIEPPCHYSNQFSHTINHHIPHTLCLLIFFRVFFIWKCVIMWHKYKNYFYVFKSILWLNCLLMFCLSKRALFLLGISLNAYSKAQSLCISYRISLKFCETHVWNYPSSKVYDLFPHN